MTNKEINPVIANKMMDELKEIFYTVKDEEVKELSRAEIDAIIRSMYNLRSPCKLIFHFSNSGIVPEISIKGEAAIKLLTDKKIQKG